jgi:hypothetical protein
MQQLTAFLYERPSRTSFRHATIGVAKRCDPADSWGRPPFDLSHRPTGLREPKRRKRELLSLPKGSQTLTALGITTD